VLTFGQAPTFPDGVDPVPLVRKGDPAMSAVFARAGASLDAFLAAWRRPPSGAAGFAVKLGLADAKDARGFTVVRPDSESTVFVEWFWCGDLQGDGARFTRADIGDWMYWRNGNIVGAATACPALAYASAQERRQMKDQFGIDCD
jgi:uncharacterized protein YegJ (DUF2314 family)